MVGRLEELVRARQSYTNEHYCQARAEIRSLVPSSALIPAAEPSQAEFEAEILQEIGYGICPQDLESGNRQPFGITSVVPRALGLEISLGDCGGSFAKFISKIAPILHDDRVNVSEEDWNSALVYKVEDVDIVRSCYLGAAADLHEIERYHIKEYPFCPRLPDA